MSNIKIILGIETSCDDTCAAILQNDLGIISCLSDTISSQDHNMLGGVFPELASRKHMELINPVISSTLNAAKINLSDIDLIAVTTSPGLKGSLLVGEMYAKTLSWLINKPLVTVNHIEGHILSVQYSCGIDFPYGYMVISGGHSIIGIAQDLGDYIELGRTIDDAAGECFDKVARSIGLSQPWGKNLEIKAKTGAINLTLPMPMSKDNTCNMSFSGLKTACTRLASKNENVSDLAASFQNIMGLFLKNRLQNAIKKHPYIKNWGIVGGVASNQSIREHLSSIDGYNLYFPPIRMCTDNAVMIGYAGIKKHLKRMDKVRALT